MQAWLLVARAECFSKLHSLCLFDVFLVFARKNLDSKSKWFIKITAGTADPWGLGRSPANKRNEYYFTGS
jgi:hypothetical protein